MVRGCSDMPEAVLEEIFSWLPPDSLISFKCVSKSWYGLIKSLVKNSIFVNKHLRNINNKLLSSATNLVFCCHRPGYCPDPRLEFLGPFELYSMLTIFNDDNTSDRLNYVSEDFDLPIPSAELDMASVLGSHCNGIICIADYYQTVMLCNPAIKECRTLPKPCLSNDGFVVLGAGFCYDSRANDYKVIRFGIDRFLPDRIENPKPRADMYSMGSDSWREIEIHLEFNRFPSRDKQVFCNGVFYWSMWARKYFIISFDVFGEVFRNIPLPDSLQFDRLKLAVWNESVALFSYPENRGVSISISIEVWVLDDCHGGVKGSCFWIKKLVVGPLVNIVTPWTFWKSDELLLEGIDGGLVSYNLDSQLLRNLTVSEFGRIGRWDFSYVKTLVSVEGNRGSLCFAIHQ
ncbi:F-box/kelch-repeat protein At3g23880 isoform X1 [Cannabis sativa]|uniref:F-box/kelch-repeat protein At3g23880 isoform X1 n=1 Tax=Cannabis sativa TaxID=3483 RepID=UPI0029C9EBCD|nr:F-box/kelch-repeat protein At3g23880 isoform X1 [Cannabis sativa]